MDGFARQWTRPEGGEEILVVTDPALLRVVTEPLRLRIFELTRDRPRTVKELAAALDVPVTRLYYHVNLLEKHGVIRVRSTRAVSGITEKTYAAAASRLSVDRSLFAVDSPALDEGAGAFVTVVLDGAKAEIQRGIAAGRIDPTGKEPAEGGMLLGRLWFRLTPAQAVALLRQFEELEETFGAFHALGTGPDVATYEMVVGFYPIDERHGMRTEPEHGDG